MEDIVIRAAIRKTLGPEPSSQKYVVRRKPSAFIVDLTEGLDDLASELRGNDYSVAVKEPELLLEIILPRGYHISAQVECVLIFIGSGVGGALINATVTDIYNSTKAWARARFKKKLARNRKWVEYRFIVYGPDGEELVKWEFDSKIEGWHLPQSVESESVHDSSDPPEASNT